MSDIETINWGAKEIPVVRDVDVLVAGGGYAGFGAAMCAARNGAKVLLVEQQSAIGGLVTMGYVALTFSYIEGIGYELFHALKANNAVLGRFLDLEKTKVILEQMLLKEGVEILYGTSIVDALVEDSTIKGAVIFNKSGFQAIKAKRSIDTSGDGDLAVFAGVPYESGCPELNNYNQASSLVMHVGNVDTEAMDGHDITLLWREAVDKAMANKEYPYMIDKRSNWMVRVPGRDPKHAEMYICYAHSRNCRCVDGFDLTRQLIEQRQQCQWTINFCRKYIPGFANSWLIDTAPLLGVRESRRIMCEYKMTGDDLVDSARFDDAVARAMHAFDAHHPTEPGHIKHIDRKREDGTVEKCYVTPGKWREIPYRALVTLKIDNLLIAGRNLSADFMGQSGTRLVLECMNMGQAAGTAAAMSIKDGVTVRKLDVQKLRQRLVEMGINLYEKPAYGASFITIEAKITPEDLIYPENNPSGQANVVLTEEAAAKYRVDVRAIEEDCMEKYLSERGYTDSGDVGTNLE
ncbi:MAG: FAD-dependent oxidoreductase [Victivallales bacterium]|nr:FAD-dependent oxidoreductase [Victivallales bacterium]